MLNTAKNGSRLADSIGLEHEMLNTAKNGSETGQREVSAPTRWPCRTPGVQNSHEARNGARTLADMNMWRSID
jgi:hypothetical protein